MKHLITWNIVGFIDRRTVSLHAKHDILIEREWRRRVAENPIERTRLSRLETGRDSKEVLRKVLAY